MSTSVVTNPNHTKNPTESTSWRKKYRPQLMNAAFFCFCVAFPFTYFGGIQNNGTLIEISFVILSVACFIPLITKK
ncbi:hypothetical protein Ga0466249_002952 [Sporomusaceae bacterium BoRhaA]|uniref:hypothetical protein n=1 Tax=Pelorhabdus rhamnosifermentans TaxID=2772457 RepID=UPI001C05F2EF|nr:hypothetical protein [Pelorhabdus rhamnosifermentans]MBU2701825.1 hypothetical protein [Pelorhabdus rhamnosifermentans]